MSSIKSNKKRKDNLFHSSFVEEIPKGTTYRPRADTGKEERPRNTGLVGLPSVRYDKVGSRRENVKDLFRNHGSRSSRLSPRGK